MKQLLFLAGLLFSFSSFSQTTPVKFSPPLAEATPESVGMSTERLAKIDAMLNKVVSCSYVLGIVALIARNGKIVFHNASKTNMKKRRYLE